MQVQVGKARVSRSSWTTIATKRAKGENLPVHFTFGVRGPVEETEFRWSNQAGRKRVQVKKDRKITEKKKSALWVSSRGRRMLTESLEAEHESPYDIRTSDVVQS